MAYSHEYPYVDPNRYNADWILNKIKELEGKMSTFEALNKITFAGEWDITKQYPAWSIVDTNNGQEGYISIQPVPAGVTIDNTDYWTTIVNYTATIADLQNRVIALESNQGDLGDLNTSDRTSLVNAINEVLGDVSNIKPHYATVADMLADSSISNGEVYLCEGYHSAGDDGVGFWRASDTATSYFHLTADNGLYLYPVCYQGRNVHQYGAYGDKTHDDAAAINAAILDSELDAVAGNGPTPIIFNGKIYKVESTIYIGCHSIKLIGRGSTILGAFSGTILETTARNSTYLHSILIDDLILQFDEDHKHTNACFKTTQAIYLSRITSLKLYGGRIGWDARKATGMDTDWGLQIDQLNVGDFTVTGLYLYESTAGSPNWEIGTIYVQCASMAATGIAINLYNLHTVHIGTIEYNQNNNGGVLLRFDYVFNAVIDAIRVEGCKTDIYRYIIANTSQVTLNSVFFNPFTVTNTTVALILGTNGAEILLNKIRCNDTDASLTKYIFRLEGTSWAALYDGKHIQNMTLYAPGTNQPDVILS